MRGRMARDRYMPETLQWTGIGVGAIAIAAAIVFALVGGYAVTHLGIDGPQPWNGARPGSPPPILGNTVLQPDPAQDLRAFTASKRALLESYAWIDREHTVARIPIERAMALVAEDAKEARR
jgi:hypothetical protein